VSASRQPVRFLTWNVRLGIQQGVPALAAVVAELRPDVAALQEVGDGWTMGPPGDTTAELAAATGLPHHRHVVAIEEPPGARFGQSLLSRWPIEAAEVTALPQEVDEPRKVLTARLAHPDGPLVVVATHLSHLDEERPRQGLVLADLAARAAGEAGAGVPVVALGDLNEPGRPPWLLRLLQGFEDADAVEARLTFPAAEPRDRRDYLLVHGGTWSDPQVPEETEASDHRPVAAVLHPGQRPV